MSFSFPPGAVTLDSIEEEDGELGEALMDVLADGKGYRARDLADSLGATLQSVRRELRRLEQDGAVTRTGRTRGTRWWLA